ncbi:hypothetical protein L1987_65618 [Smallanthus sonchifolius]|uniref:Uncharacterized protein n=1 Tax=Smallanthus sonchifolius TaxID=185202 RepID=A0ACB9BUZ0_9ASTR|nr:hypothetical protein L1987_65618 [Smallanthus sonchifolius]
MNSKILKVVGLSCNFLPDIAFRIVEDRPELASNGNVLGVLAKKRYAFPETTTNIFKKFINLAFRRGSKPGMMKKDNGALQLLRLIWENIAKKPKKEIDDIIRGPPDTIKKDEKLPYNKKDQKLHLLKLISENIVKMPVEIQKLTAGPSAKITRASTMLGKTPIETSLRKYEWLYRCNENYYGSRRWRL